MPFCKNCGRELSESAVRCEACGREVESMQSAWTAQPQEAYLGGFSTTGLARRSGLDVEPGYGLYATDKRIIIIRAKESRGGVGWTMNTGAMFGSIGPKARPFLDTGPKSLTELLVSKNKFEFGKEDVSEIELKPPGKVFAKGHLTIKSKSGSEFKLLLVEDPGDYGSESFELARDLLKRFSPELLKVNT